MKSYMKIIAALLTLSSAAAHADVINMQQTIYSNDNLFYTDWGHYWTQQGDGDYLVANNTDGALNDGQAARYVSSNGSAFAFNRDQIQSLTITLSGSVMNNGTLMTDASGDDCYITKACGFHDGYFHNLPVYSVIGLWSTTADTITPVKYDAFGKAYAAGDAGYDDLVATTAAPFFIGNGGAFDFSAWIPDSVDNLYLFLGENDGAFSDNNPQQFYTASINIVTPEVPVPAAAWLMGSSLIGLASIARRRRIG